MPKITKTRLEQRIFWNDRQLPESAKYAGERGTLIHEAVYTGLTAIQKGVKPNRIEGKIARKGKVREVAASRQIDFFAPESEPKLDDNDIIDRAAAIVRSIVTLYGRTTDWQAETSVFVPAGIPGTTGLLSCRADLVIKGDNPGVADIKTGKIPEREEIILFNLFFLALEHVVVNSGVQKPTFYGKRFKYHSPRNLRELAIQGDALLALVWPNHVITNLDFGLSTDELFHCRNDVNDWILTMLTKDPTSTEN